MKVIKRLETNKGHLFIVLFPHVNNINLLGRRTNIKGNEGMDCILCISL